jgi:signal transduction histidine kinase
MVRHCLLLSVAVAIVVLIGVELAVRAPGQGDAVALVAAVAAGVVMQLGLAAFVVRPLRDQQALLRERVRLAELAQERLAELEAGTSSLRHDLRGILSPSLMMADRLLDHADPKVRRVGEVMVQTVERCSERLSRTRAGPPGQG